MRQIANGLVIVAVISMVVGIISRMTLTPIQGIESQAMFNFANTCLLLVIALILLEKK